eukprot:scaffold3302_cov335-Prasinococcus_capsulatus_cf.AAC.2
MLCAPSERALRMGERQPQQVLFAKGPPRCGRRCAERGLRLLHGATRRHGLVGIDVAQTAGAGCVVFAIDYYRVECAMMHYRFHLNGDASRGASGPRTQMPIARSVPFPRRSHDSALVALGRWRRGSRGRGVGLEHRAVEPILLAHALVPCIPSRAAAVCNIASLSGVASGKTQPARSGPGGGGTVRRSAGGATCCARPATVVDGRRASRPPSRCPR